MFCFVVVVVVFKFTYLFILRERERERAHKREEGQREGKTKIPSRLCTIGTEPDLGLELTNC